MPLDRFVLLLVVVIAAAGLTVWLAALLAASSLFPGLTVAGLIPTALAMAVLGRVVARRLGSREDHRYDRVRR